MFQRIPFDDNEDPRPEIANIPHTIIIRKAYLNLLESRTSSFMWQQCPLPFRLKYMRDNKWDFKFNSFREMLSCARGKTFISNNPARLINHPQLNKS